MGYFPIFTDITGKRCIIIGGGRVASRKVDILLRFGADVHVIAETVCDDIRKVLAPENREEREATEEDIHGAILVIAATSSREVNHTVYTWCEKHRIPVNVIDCPKECTFLFPSVVQRGDITIGINTAGSSPIVSKKIRKEIEAAIPAYYEEIAVQLGRVKERLKRNIRTEAKRAQILREIAAEAFSRKRALNDEELKDIIHDTNRRGPS